MSGSGSGGSGHATFNVASTLHAPRADTTHAANAHTATTTVRKGRMKSEINEQIHAQRGAFGEMLSLKPPHGGDLQRSLNSCLLLLSACL